MKHHRRHMTEDPVGLTAIEQRVTDIALLMRETFPKCSWHFEHGAGQSEMRRLDIEIAGEKTTIFFATSEVRTYSSTRQDKEIDHRLHCALSAVLPSPLAAAIKTAFDRYYRK